MQLQWENLGRGAIGMFFLILVCFLLSNNRSAISWKLVLIGILAQVMFAMGVLHTTLAGQPVFWVLAAVVLVYTIVRKFRRAKSGEAPVSYTGSALLTSYLWQVLFVAGLLLANRLFGSWASL